MTFLEKRVEQFDPFVKGEFIMDYCPSEFNYDELKNELCYHIDHYDSELCEKCWNREIPEEKGETNMENLIKERAILDSGERRQFETGAVRDIQEGKGRCDLMPLDVISTIMEDPTLANIFQYQKTGSADYLVDAVKDFSNLFYTNLCDMFLEVSIHFEEGAKKYGENNWQKGIPTKHYIDSGVRHYLKWLRGDKDEPHDRAFVWNMICCLWTIVNKPELDSYYKEVSDGKDI